jgi:hypothetical protein
VPAILTASAKLRKRLSYRNAYQPKPSVLIVRAIINIRANRKKSFDQDIAGVIFILRYMFRDGENAGAELPHHFKRVERVRSLLPPSAVGANRVSRNRHASHKIQASRCGWRIILQRRLGVPKIDSHQCPAGILYTAYKA